MVKVEPLRSSPAILPSLAAAPRRAISAAISTIDFRSASLTTGTIRPWSVEAAMPML